MFYNYLKIAYRTLIGQRVYSIINIAGLALGLTAFVLILQYVSLEYSVNKFHQKLPVMQQVLCQDPKGESWLQVEPGWPAKWVENFPEVRAFCRFADGIGEGIVKNDANNTSFREEKVGYADGNFFTLFTFPLLQGEATALEKPNVVFISASMALKYFGQDNALGKTLMLYNQFGNQRYTVEGVFEDMGDNSDIRFDLVFSLATLKSEANLNDNDWANLDNLDTQFAQVMLEVAPGSNIAALEAKMNELRRRLQPEKDAVSLRVRPFSQAHLAADFSDTLYHTGSLRYVWMLSGLATLILLIAWFNYINLSTANSLRRAGEVGIRKATGATVSHLVAQFLTETLLVNGLALMLACGLVWLLQPFFNELVGKKLSLFTLFDSSAAFVGIGVLFLGSLFSGVWAARLLAGFNPVETMRGKVAQRAGGLRLRQFLVIAQFGISAGLILATIVIFSQLRFMQNKDLGMQLDHLLIIRGPEIGTDETYATRRTAFWGDIANQSFVKDYCTSGCVPGDIYNFSTAGFTSPKSKPGDEEDSYKFAIIGERYLGTFGIALTAGRNFTAEECAVAWNNNSKILVNEKAAAALGLSPEEALTTKIRWDERELDIVGVVKDYHHSGLQQPIAPIIFYPQNNRAYLTLRLSADQLPEKIGLIKTRFQQYFPGNPFDYFFADDNFEQAYKTERRYSSLFSAASLWAIFIACMGLYGLVAFTAGQRTKEIGIRKVLGATTIDITNLLAKDFLKLVLIAIAVATPITWYFMRGWLSNFAYQISLQWWMFVLAGFVALAIAMLTVSIQSVKAALANPVKSLRSE
jgi:putative ABC transport system permease protein